MNAKKYRINYRQQFAFQSYLKGVLTSLQGLRPTSHPSFAGNAHLVLRYATSRKPQDTTHRAEWPCNGLATSLRILSTCLRLSLSPSTTSVSVS